MVAQKRVGFEELLNNRKIISWSLAQGYRTRIVTCRSLYRGETHQAANTQTSDSEEARSDFFVYIVNSRISLRHHFVLFYQVHESILGLTWHIRICSSDKTDAEVASESCKCRKGICCRIRRYWCEAIRRRASYFDQLITKFTYRWSDCRIERPEYDFLLRLSHCLKLITEEQITTSFPRQEKGMGRHEKWWNGVTEITGGLPIAYWDRPQKWRKSWVWGRNTTTNETVVKEEYWSISLPENKLKRRRTLKFQNKKLSCTTEEHFLLLYNHKAKRAKSAPVFTSLIKPWKNTRVRASLELATPNGKGGSMLRWNVMEKNRCRNIHHDKRNVDTQYWKNVCRSMIRYYMPMEEKYLKRCSESTSESTRNEQSKVLLFQPENLFQY